MKPALGLLVATLAVSALLAGCGGGGGGGSSCTDLFTTPLVYTGHEDIEGTCYQNPDYGPIMVTVTQATGTCDVSFVFTNDCSGTLSDHELPFTCTNGYSGKVTFSDDLSTFTGSFTWSTPGGCTGTTTFKSDIARAE
jgi:hypothetical protein